MKSFCLSSRTSQGHTVFTTSVFTEGLSGKPQSNRNQLWWEKELKIKQPSRIEDEMIAIKNYSYVYATIIIKENIKLRVQGSMRGTGRNLEWREERESG